MRVKKLEAYNLLDNLIGNSSYPIAMEVIDDIIYSLSKILPDKLSSMDEYKNKDINDVMWDILQDLGNHLKVDGLRIYATKGTSLNKLAASYLYKKYNLKFDNPNFSNRKVRNIEFSLLKPEEFNLIGSGEYEGNTTCFNYKGEHRLAVPAFIEAGIIPMYVRDGNVEGRLFVGVRYVYKPNVNEDELDVSRLYFVLHNLYIKNGGSDLNSIAAAFAGILTIKTNLTWKKLSGYPDNYLNNSFIDYYLNSGAYTIRCYNLDGNEFTSLEFLKDYIRKEGYVEDFLNRYLGYKGGNIFDVAMFIGKHYNDSILKSMIARFYCYVCGDVASDIVSYLPVCKKHTQIPQYKCYTCARYFNINELVAVENDKDAFYMCKNCYKDKLCQICGKRLKEVRVDDINLCGICLAEKFDRCHICNSIGDREKYRDYKLGNLMVRVCEYCQENNICNLCGKEIKITPAIPYCYTCIEKLNKGDKYE